MKTPKLYISRNYVEFGPFEAAEVAAFHARGIVSEEDHLHVVGSDTWITAQQWLQTGKSSKVASPKAKAAKPAAKKAVTSKKKEKIAA